MIGKRYGTLTIIKDMGRDYARNKLYLVKCTCGNLETRTVTNIKSKPKIFWKTCKRCNKVFRYVKAVAHMEKRAGAEPENKNAQFI